MAPAAKSLGTTKTPTPATRPLAELLEMLATMRSS
jgi:hypothetical protein